MRDLVQLHVPESQPIWSVNLDPKVDMRVGLDILVELWDEVKIGPLARKG
jgi:hypothetical protein